MRHRFLLAVLLLAAPSLGAQESPSSVDSRLLPLLGCWVNTSDNLLAKLATPSNTLCIVPGATASAVRLLSVRGDSVVNEEVLDVGGRRQPVTRESCRGFSTARFAESGARIFIEETLECNAGVTARSTELLDLAGPLEFVQVRGWRQKTAGDARLARWTALDDTARALPAEVRRALAGRLGNIGTAREMTASDVTFDGIVEATQALEEPVVRAWVYARGAGNRVRVTGAQLRTLKRRGVPGTVTDVLVALANPEVFRFAPQGMVAMAEREGGRGGAGWGNAWGPWMGGGWGAPGAFAFGNPCFTGWGLCAWDPFYWNGFGNGWLGLNRFGWGGWGGGWNGWGGWGGWGGWPIGGAVGGGGLVPVYVGNQPSGGYVDRRRGYTPGDGGGGGSAQPRGGVPSTSTGSSGGGGGASSGGGYSSGGGGGGGGGRVAVPKPPL